MRSTETFVALAAIYLGVRHHSASALFHALIEETDEVFRRTAALPVQPGGETARKTFLKMPDCT